VALCIRIDRLEANIEEITVGAWRKAPGDPVALGEAVVEIITDKITFEYESEAEGVLRAIVAPEKSVVPVHYVIGVVAEPDEPLPAYEADNATLLARLGQGVNVHEAAGFARPEGVGAAAGSERVRATPAARRRARELGVDLAQVASRVEGAVQASDVERFHAGELS
jgi:pyruvate dehydrogenase E2 component (dihydrolipoamide acetyltransferase)